MSKTLRDQIFRALAATPAGLTTEELELQMGGAHQTISPRVNELARDGLVVNSGTHRRTRSNKKAIVWRLASEKGPAKALPMTWKTGFGKLLAVTLEVLEKETKGKKQRDYAVAVRSIVARVGAK